MLRPGERIGDWIVEARLGEGEHGAIFLARHGLNLNLRGALKVARPPDYEKARTNFIAEIEPLLMLRHEALIHVLGWGEDPDRNLLWMTTELVRGRSLEERLDQGPFELEELGFVFGRLAGALALIHSHGASHGDLRPSDVLLAEGRHIRITGFGTVFRESNQGQLDAESLAYVGPEYFDDPESCSPVSADIYALGLILHEAITGKRVFPVDPALKPAPQMARIMGMKMRMGPLDPGEDVPLPLRRIVLQTTDPDPETRPPDLSGFLTALSMATREREDSGDFVPALVEPELAPAAAAAPEERLASVKEPGAAPTAAPERSGEAPTVKLESSVLRKQERATPFPFAPPGWGPRAHRVPSPMAGLVRPPAPDDAAEPVEARGVHVLERDSTPPAPPVAEEALFEEPEILDPPVSEAPEPLEAPAAAELVEPVEPSAPLPEVEEEVEEAVLVEPAPDPTDEGPWAVHDGPPAPEPPIAEPSSLRRDREQQRRAFVPPPPVPDPSFVAPASPPEPPPEADEPQDQEPPLDSPPATESPAPHVEAPPVESPRVVVPPAPSVEAPPEPELRPVRPAGLDIIPPAPQVLDPMPTPVPPGEAPSEDADVAIPPLAAAPPEEAPTVRIPPEPRPLETPVEAVHEASTTPFEPSSPRSPAVSDIEAPSAPSLLAPSVPPPAEPAPRAVVPSEPQSHHTHVPLEEPGSDGLADEVGWSWHEEGGAHEEEDPTEEQPDAFSRPIDDLYADDLEPSASDIAADVFGDHGESTVWLKWALPIAALVAIAIVVFLTMDHGDPKGPEPTPERPVAEVVETPPPPPVEPPPVEESPEPGLTAEELGLDLPSEEPAVEVAPAPSPRQATSSSGSQRAPRTAGSSTRGSSRPQPAPAPAPVPAPVPEPERAPESVAVAEVEPVAERATPTGKGVMDHLRDGWASLDSGNLVGAQGAFMAALTVDSGNGMAHYGLGQVAERARDYRSAAYHYGRALGALGGNPTMKGELEAAIRRVNSKAGAAAAPAPAPSAAPVETSGEDEGVEVTRKKRDALEESFRDELWDLDETK